MASPPIPADLAAAWQHALAHWNHHGNHDTLLGLAAKHRRLAWLAARYRDAARTNPDDPVAQTRLARVANAAMIALVCQGRPRDAETKRPYRAVGALLLAAVAATGLCLYLTEYRVQHQQGALISRQP